jgi:hypothetical protein
VTNQIPTSIFNLARTTDEGLQHLTKGSPTVFLLYLWSFIYHGKSVTQHVNGSMIQCFFIYIVSTSLTLRRMESTPMNRRPPVMSLTLLPVPAGARRRGQASGNTAEDYNADCDLETLRRNNVPQSSAAAQSVVTSLGGHDRQSAASTSSGGGSVEGRGRKRKQVSSTSQPSTSGGSNGSHKNRRFTAGKKTRGVTGSGAWSEDGDGGAAADALEYVTDPPSSDVGPGSGDITHGHSRRVVLDDDDEFTDVPSSSDVESSPFKKN